VAAGDGAARTRGDGEGAMLRIRHVLCPTDFSTFSERALRYGVVFAKWLGADVTVLHVHPASERNRDDLEARLEEFAAPARAAAVDVRTEILEGDAVAAILAEARRTPDALLVLGTHGHGGFENLVLGSVTEKVLRKSPVPVLSVPRHPEGSPGASLPLGTILCPVDFSPSSRAAVAVASGLAIPAGSSLVLVHVMRELPVADAPETAHFNVPEYRRALENEARNRLREFARETAMGPPSDLRILAGKPYRRILHLAHEVAADLVVMGVQGRNAADLLLFGSTAHHVVRAAPCPVLTVRG
jgi:nucleotide-binding universal stress UspA family protein